MGSSSITLPPIRTERNISWDVDKDAVPLARESESPVFADIEVGHLGEYGLLDGAVEPDTELRRQVSGAEIDDEFPFVVRFHDLFGGLEESTHAGRRANRTREQVYVYAKMPTDARRVTKVTILKYYGFVPPSI
jgi:hypothetical protein